MANNENVVRIICNPYTNKIEYRLLDPSNEEWNPLSSGSELNNEKFTDTVLQKVAYEVIKKLNMHYTRGTTELKIIFEGTAENYRYLEEIINTYFSTARITLQKGERYLLSADEVKNRIDEIFKRLNDDFNDCSNEDVKKLIQKYIDTVCPTVPICVMGLYSSGKSAFINALLGFELLPSNSDPNTAKVYKIALGDKNEIRFKLNKDNNGQKEITLMFDGSVYRIDPSENSELFTELDRVKEYDTVEKRMYNAVKIINDYAPGENEPSIDDFIEITVNKNAVGFGMLYSDMYNFVIYDTPGSNSAKNIKHLEVLREAIKEQTNGLPILVTTPDTLDAKDNKVIIDKIFGECADALDKSNLMVIINKADDKSDDTLRKKKETVPNQAIYKLDPAGFYFISSPVGLGCKKILSGNLTADGKNPNFIDKDYKHTFKTNICVFKDEEDEDLKKLYEYNIVPRKQYDDYNYLQMEEKYFAYQNSGIHAIESAIVDFAEKYALYNKCKNASDYLSSAIELLGESIAAEEEKKGTLSQELKSKMDDKLKVVLKELEEVCNNAKKELLEAYVKSQDEYVSESLRKVNKGLGEKLDNIRKSCWKKETRLTFETRQEATARKISNLLKNEVDTYYEGIKNIATDIFNGHIISLKANLTSVITNSDNLTEDQRIVLRENIQKLEPTRQEFFPKISWERIYTGFLWTFNQKGTQKIFESDYKKYIRQFNLDISEVMKIKLCKDFINDVEKNFYDLVQKYNPEVRKLNKDWQKCNNDISDLHNRQNKIKNCKNDAVELTKFKITSYDEKGQ